eukprot:scaffold16811_cov97-Isochrysis_galbana.AAC.2
MRPGSHRSARPMSASNDGKLSQATAQAKQMGARMSGWFKSKVPSAVGHGAINPSSAGPALSAADAEQQQAQRLAQWKAEEADEKAKIVAEMKALSLLESDEVARLDSEQEARRNAAETAQQKAAAVAARVMAEEAEAARVMAEEAAAAEAARVMAEEAETAPRVIAEEAEAARVMAEEAAVVEAARVMAEEAAAAETARVMSEEAAAAETARVMAEEAAAAETAQAAAAETARVMAEEAEAARVMAEEAAAAEARLAFDAAAAKAAELVARRRGEIQREMHALAQSGAASRVAAMGVFGGAVKRVEASLTSRDEFHGVDGVPWPAETVTTEAAASASNGESPGYVGEEDYF